MMVAIIVTSVLVIIIIQAATFPLMLHTTANISEVVPICMVAMYLNMFTIG